VRHLQGKVWELRVRTRGEAYRLLYFFHTEQQIVFVHAFVKKSQKTPSKEMNLAMRRWNDFLEQKS
jgi:phage-related protein